MVQPLLKSGLTPADTGGSFLDWVTLNVHEEEGLNFGPILAAAMFAAASSQIPANATHTPVSVQNNAVTVTVQPASHASASPKAGEMAPDFTYQSHEDLWQNLHNMLEQGDVLLVFGANDEQLRAIERSRDGLLRGGVLPVAVVEHRDADVWGTVRRLNLTFSLLADPHASISEEFGVYDPATKRSRPTWFVIDRAGRVRQSGEGTAAVDDWSQLAAQALGHSDVKSASAN